MTNEYYHFKIGQFSCVAISDGGLNYPVESFFKDIPLEQAKSLLKEHNLPTIHVHTPYTLLYIDTGQHKVLVDTGMGRYGALAEKMFPMIDNSTTRCGILQESMHIAGLDRAGIDTIIITHAHPDHIGGNLDADGKLSFPNARYFIWKDEWDFWFSDERTAQAPPHFVEIARTNLDPLRDRITFVDKEGEIVPGLSAVATPGHTPGHMAVALTSDGEQCIHVSDAVLHPIHLEHPEMVLVFDMDPAQTIASKRMICNRAADQNALVFAHHLPPFPNLGHIVRQGNGWCWQPITERIAHTV